MASISAIRLGAVLPPYAWEGLAERIEMPAFAELEQANLARLTRDEEDLRHGARRARTEDRNAVVDLFDDAASAARDLLVSGTDIFRNSPYRATRIDGILAYEYLTALTGVAERKLTMEKVKPYVRKTVVHDFAVYRGDLLAITKFAGVPTGTLWAVRTSEELLGLAAGALATGVDALQAALARVRQGQEPQDAEGGCRDLLQGNPYDLLAAVALARLLNFRGDLEERRQILATARKSGIAKSQLAFEECQLMVAAGQAVEARRFAREILRDPDLASTRWDPEVRAHDAIRALAGLRSDPESGH